MRWFLGVLVAINLAILAWGVLRDEAAPRHDLAMPGVGTIRLLNEVGGVQDQAPSGGVAATSAQQQAEPGDERDAVVAGARPLPAPAAAIATADGADADQPGQTAAEPAASPMPGQAAEDTAAPAAEQVAVAQPGSGEAATETVPAEVPPPVAEPEPARFCSRIGPFKDDAAAAPVRDYLVERGGQVISEERTTQTRIGYWVLVPPQASRAAAREVAAQLKAQGLEYWIIPNGELRNAISLGLFSGQDNADDFAEQMRGKGFDAEVRDKTRDSSQVWLDYQGDVYVPAEQIRSRAPEGVTIEERDCP